jgi:hypothetical protein
MRRLKKQFLLNACAQRAPYKAHLFHAIQKFIEFVELIDSAALKRGR